MRSLASIAAGTLLGMLSLRIHARKASSVTSLLVSGKENEMEDIVSRALKEGIFFSLLTVSLQISIITSLSHITSLREITTLLLNEYR